jgi:predicted O-methyltransferase YrrM
MIGKITRLLMRALGRPHNDRYPNLFRIIRGNDVKRIMEIGTWNGGHALKMIETAQRKYPGGQVEYYGFDLFDSMDDKKSEEEFSKRAPTMDSVNEKLKSTGAKVKLIRGDTRKTLPANVKKLPKMDFIFIDGGHSIKTIENDWSFSEKLMHDRTTVVFDDYFRNDEPEVEGIGAQYIIDKLDRKIYEVVFLKPECHFKKPWGTLNTSMVQVTKRK